MFKSFRPYRICCLVVYPYAGIARIRFEGLISDRHLPTTP